MASIIYASPTGRLSMVEFDATGSEEHTQSAETTDHAVEEGVDIVDHARPALALLNLTGTITNTPINSNTVDTTYLETDVRPVGLIIGEPTPFRLEAPEFAKGGVAKQPGLTVQKQSAQGTVMGGWVSPFRPPGSPRPAGRAEAFPTQYTSVDNSVGGTSFQALTAQDRVRICFDILMGLCREGREVRVITSLRDYETMLITSVSAPVAGQDSIDFSIAFKEVRYASVVKGVNVVKRPKEKRAKKAESKGPIGPGYKLSSDPDTGSSDARSAGLAGTGN